MDDFLIDLGVAIVLRVANDPKGKGKWRRALLKIFRAIAKAFPDDIEFRQASAEFHFK